jgi:hypothetical protein
MLSLAATVVAGNFGPGYTYGTLTSEVVGNDFLGHDVYQAVGLAPSGSAIFNTLRLALNCGFACPDNFTAALYTNNMGAPGTALETFTVDAASLGSFGSNNPPVVFSSTTHSLLSPGLEYWVVVGADMNDSIGWNLNSTADNSPTVRSFDSGATWSSGSTPGAFEIDGTAVPEPSSVALLLGSALLLGFVRKLRRS